MHRMWLHSWCFQLNNSLPELRLHIVSSIVKQQLLCPCPGYARDVRKTSVNINWSILCPSHTSKIKWILKNFKNHYKPTVTPRSNGLMFRLKCKFHSLDYYYLSFLQNSWVNLTRYLSYWGQTMKNFTFLKKKLGNHLKLHNFTALKLQTVSVVFLRLPPT